MRQAAHAVLLILADRLAGFGGDEDDGVVRCLQRLGMPGAHPHFGLGLVFRTHPEAARLAVFTKLDRALFLTALEERDLPLAAVHQIIEERGLHRARIEAGGRELVEQHVARLDRAEHVLPDLRDRAFLGEQGPRAELEGDGAELGIVDPVVPVAQVPHAPCHHDRHAISNALGAHHVPQRLDARIGIFRLGRVFGVGKAVVPARQPRVFIDHRCHQIGHLVVGPLPKRAESAARADDRQIADIEARRYFRELVGHACAAGDTRHHPAGVFQHAFEHGLRPAHFPQHVDVDRALAVRDFVGLLHLRGGAVDGVADQFLMALLAGAAVVDLRNDVAVRVIAVGIDRADGADPACRGPCARTGVIGRRNTLAAFDQRPHFTPAIDDRAQSLEQ